MPDPHEVLGVAADADEEAIVAAYRERVKEAHPDQGGTAREFRAVQRAYERLTDPTADLEAPETQPAADEPHPTGHVTAATVEYLDYEVAAERGWSLSDGECFEQAATADDLDAVDYGTFVVRPGESLLEAAERRGYAWPFACRGGACANCAVGIVEGELSQPVDHILPEELLERDVRLSCNGYPLTDELRVVYNLKSLPVLEDLRLPPGPFKLAYGDGTA